MQESKPFNPEEDSVFGKILFETFETTIEKQVLNKILQTWRYSRPDFVVSSGVQRQYYLSSLPVVIRKFFSEEKYNAVIYIVLLPLREQNCLDITLELIEWIFSSYDEDNLILEILDDLTRNMLPFPENMIEKMKHKYSQLF